MIPTARTRVLSSNWIRIMTRLWKALEDIERNEDEV